MTLRELSKEVQPLVEDGIATLLIYKRGRSWEYEAIWDMEEEKAVVESVSRIDENYEILSTYECFASSALNYIAFQIKRLYEENKYEDTRDTDEIKTFNEAICDNEKCFELSENEEKLIETAENGKKMLEDVTAALKIQEYIDEDVKLSITLTAEQAMYLSLFARNHYAGSEQNLLTKKPIFLVLSAVEENGVVKAYRTKAYFFIKEEAQRYIRYQGHNLNKPRIFADYMGYSNNGEYEHFYDLLMSIGTRLNEDEKCSRTVAAVEREQNKTFHNQYSTEQGIKQGAIKGDGINGKREAKTYEFWERSKEKAY